MPKKILIITAIVIVIIALGTTAVYITQRQVGEKVERQAGIATLPETPEKPIIQPEEPITTEPIDTSDWKTYRNKEYEFEIKYPRGFEEFRYSSEISGGIRLILEGPHEYSLLFEFEGRRFRTPVTGRDPRKPWPDPCVPPELEPGETQTMKVISGVKFIRTETEGGTVLYMGKHKDICYYFWFGFYRDKDKYAENLSLFEQMVSTFRILE